MRKKFTQLMVGGISLTLAFTSLPNQVMATNLEDLSEKVEVSTEANVELDVAEEADADINPEVDSDIELDVELDAELQVQSHVQRDEDETLECVVVLESTKKHEFIKRLYETCLGRTPSPSEVEYWVGTINAGESTGNSLADYFMNSEELKSQNLSNTAYIKVMYKAFFDRTADEGGLEYWLERMASGLSRGEALGLFIDSEEYTNICLEYGIEKGEMVETDEAPEWYTPVQKFVYRFYKKCMDRVPDLDGLNYWALGLELEQFTGKDVAENFVNSTEFINKNLSDSEYLDVMYRVFFDRPADQAGKNYWLDILNASNRNMVLHSFIHSNEFFNICASYGILAIDENPDIKGFTRGTGTKENPYVITKSEQMLLIENNINKINENTYFVLGQDLNMQGVAFESIGKKTAFKGQFDGRGYTITGLTINNGGTYGAMFQSTAPESSISNVNLEKVTVLNSNSSSNTGALVANNEGKIINCHVNNGFIKASYNYTGGLVGRNKGEIHSSSFEGTSTCSSTLGGLVGRNDGTINASYAKAENNTQSWVGGLIGENRGTVMNSYAISNSKTYYSYAGGLIGEDYNGKVYNCFSAGSVNGHDNKRGGFVGRSEYGYFENCYTTTKLNDVTTLEDKNNGLFTGYAFNVTLNTCYGNIDTFTSWGENEGDRINCKLLTTMQMKTDNFTQTLNNNIGSTYWKKWTRNNNINEGLPYFIN